MAGILSGITLGSNLPQPTFRDGTPIRQFGQNLNAPLPDPGVVLGPLAFGSATATNATNDTVDVDDDRTDLEKADDIAVRGAQLQQRLQLLQRLLPTSPGTIGPQIQALDAEIVELFKEYQKLTDGPEILGPNGEKLKRKTITPGEDRAFTADELQLRLNGETIPDETIYVDEDGNQVEPVEQEDPPVGPNGEELTEKIIKPGVDRAFTSAELLRRLDGETIPDETIYVDEDGNQVEPVDPNAEEEEPAPVAGVDRAFTVAELLERSKSVDITA